MNCVASILDLDNLERGGDLRFESEEKTRPFIRRSISFYGFEYTQVVNVDIRSGNPTMIQYAYLAGRINSLLVFLINR